MKLLEPEGDRRGEEITSYLTMEGLEDILVHFLPLQRPWFQDGRTWSMVWLGR